MSGVAKGTARWHNPCFYPKCQNSIGRKGARGYCGGHYRQLRLNQFDDTLLSPLEHRLTKNRDKAPEGYKTCNKCFVVLPSETFYCGHCSVCEASYKRERTYGLSHDDFLALLNSQDGRCAICNVSVLDDINIDHDHVTDQVRGILCTNCNLGLGNFRDSIDFLEGSIRYLKKGGG